MSAQNFYEQMRKLGLTEDITSNESPDYHLPFYQSIFRLMEEFSKKEHEEKIRWILVEESLPVFSGKPFFVITLSFHGDESPIRIASKSDVQIVKKYRKAWRYFL